MKLYIEGKSYLDEFSVFKKAHGQYHVKTKERNYILKPSLIIDVLNNINAVILLFISVKLLWNICIL